MPSIGYGLEATGLSNSALADVRRVVARAAGTSTAGGNVDCELLAKDGMAQAWWDSWRQHEQLEQAFTDAITKLSRPSVTEQNAWNRCTGPTTAGILSAARLGFHTAVLDPQPDAPAFQVANHQIVAAYDNLEGLNQLASLSDVITYEFENVPVDAFRKLNDDIKIQPSVLALETSQDRLVEKGFFADSGRFDALPECPLPGMLWVFVNQVA